MILASLMGLLPWLLASEMAPAAGVRVMRVEEQMIIRVPVRPKPRVRVTWSELERGPQCIFAQRVSGAMLSGSDTIDFLMQRGGRLRARLDSDCAGLDFYSGFYLQSEDNRICAKRDSIRSRDGGSCRIERFRRLAPRVAD